MITTRTRQLTKTDKLLCVIDEIVTSNGYYITWPEFFSSFEEAEKFRIEKSGN